MPQARLAEGRVREATEINAKLPGVVSRLLNLPGTTWAAVAEPLLAQLKEVGHVTWLSGGAARDLIGGGEIEDINDLDLAGTAPTGQFTELARKVLRRLGVEHREKVSSKRLVCSARPALGGEPIYEYRTLNTTAFRYPASGSDLTEDVSTRDFTVNSLYYDPSNDTVVDPSGRAVADVSARPRRLLSINTTTDPLAQATIILRAIKFTSRWTNTVGVDPSEMRDWAPPNLLAHLDESAWDALIPAYDECLSGISSLHQQDAADKLGPVAIELLTELSRRAHEHASAAK